MTKTYKIEVDCANCAREMEEAAAKISGVQSVTVVARQHKVPTNRQPK